MILSFHSTLVTPGTAPFRCGWVPGTLSGRGCGRPGHGKWPLTWLLPCPAHSQGHGTQPFCPRPRLGQKLCRAPGPATVAGRRPLPRPAASTTLMGHRSGVGERGPTRHSGPPPSPHPRCPVLCTAADGPSPSTPNVQWVWAPRPAAGRGRGNAPPSAGAPCRPQEPLQSRPARAPRCPTDPKGHQGQKRIPCIFRGTLSRKAWNPRATPSHSCSGAPSWDGRSRHYLEHPRRPPGLPLPPAALALLALLALARASGLTLGS